MRRAICHATDGGVHSTQYSHRSVAVEELITLRNSKECVVVVLVGIIGNALSPFVFFLFRSLHILLLLQFFSKYLHREFETMAKRKTSIEMLCVHIYTYRYPSDKNNAKRKGGVSR
jgi:hypothetical protein